MGNIHIGTSGWSYDHWQGVLYPDPTPVSKRLDYYLAQFDTVELNSSRSGGPILPLAETERVRGLAGEVADWLSALRESAPLADPLRQPDQPRTLG